jgi:hypothetical protein
MFRLWQWTWGLPQTLLGAVIYLICRDCPHDRYRGTIATYWKNKGSLGVVMFLFLGSNDPQVRVHEYGHAVQSMILGPLFLPVMGLPSILWCNLPPCRRLRKEKGVSYYSFYPEKSANHLGRLATKEPCNLK